MHNTCLFVSLRVCVCVREETVGKKTADEKKVTLEILW